MPVWYYGSMSAHALTTPLLLFRARLRRDDTIEHIELDLGRAA
jgi:hypothetical protein